MDNTKTEKPDEAWSVEKALADAGITIPDSVTSPLPFFHILERLKTTKRQGWRLFGIEGESIADHMHRMAIMAMTAPPSLAATLDLNKCVKMALVHDIAESLVGDITPADRVPRAEKNRRESLTIDFLTQRLLAGTGASTGTGTGTGPSGHLPAGGELRAVWQEFEEATTPESQFVQDLDKVELLLQMAEYEEHHQVDLSTFAYVASKVRLPELRAWADEILDTRRRTAGERRVVGAPTAEALQDQYYGSG